MVLMINLTGSLAGVGANPPAGVRDIGTGPVTFGNESMDRLGILCHRSHRPGCASPDVGRFCDDSQSLGLQQYIPSHIPTPIGTPCLRECGLVGGLLFSLTCQDARDTHETDTFTAKMSAMPGCACTERQRRSSTCR